MGKELLRTVVNQKPEVVYMLPEICCIKKEIQWFAGLSRSLNNSIIKNYQMFKNICYCIFSKLLYSLSFHADLEWKERVELSPFSSFVGETQLSTSLKISCKFTANMNSHFYYYSRKSDLQNLLQQYT